MLKQEWKNIFHHTWMKVVLIAIILIPSLYACIFLGSMWDPYGNTDKIPVAVVNHDQAVDYGNNTLNVGKELTEQLQNNQSMNFQSVDEKKAKEGLKNSEYYMIIRIPEDFSKNATTLLDQKPQKMKLQYITNPGSNYIASKMDDSAIEKIKEEVSQTVTKTYAKTIFEQVDTLTAGLKEAQNGTSQLVDGSKQTIDGNQQISDNLQVLANSSLTFEDGVQTFSQGLKDYTDGVLTVHNGVYSLKTGLDTFNDSTKPLNDGVQQLATGSSSLNQGLQQYTNGVLQTYQGAQKLVGNNEALNNGLNNLDQGVQQLVDGNKQVSEGLTQLNEQLENRLSSDNMNKIATASRANDSLNQATTLLNQMMSINPAMAQSWMNKTLSADEASIIVPDNQTAQYLLTHYSYTELVKTVTGGNQEAINQLKTGLTQVYENTQKLEAGSQKVQAGLESAKQSVEETLKPGFEAYVNGVTQVYGGLDALNNQSQTLLDGSQQINNGLSTLQQQTPTLISGIQQLDQGARALYDGTAKIVSNNDTLIDGAAMLSDGSQKMKDGSQQLSDGSKTLQTGLQTLQKGLETLDKSLADGVEKATLDIDEQTLDMMSAPVETSHQEISVVENNGHAMAPYMMSVALYVAALAWTLMYPIRQGIKQAASAFKYWLSKASVMYSISTLAAIVLITALRWICGFEPQQLLLTYLFAIIVSAAFMSLVMLLSLTTGYIGEFLLLIFMIINLGGSAGTYPLETSGFIYKIIHPFVPYTYSVNGFRKVISMANASISTEIIVFASIIIICSLLTILYYRFKNKEDQHLIPEAFEKVNE